MVATTTTTTYNWLAIVEQVATLTQVATTAADMVKEIDSSLSQNPPDFVRAFETLNEDGWKIVEAVTPLRSRSDEKFANAERAWQEAFDGAGERTRDLIGRITSQNKAQIIEAVTDTVSKALKACSTAMPENSKYFDAIEKLFVGVSESGIDFLKAVGLIDASSLIQSGSNSQADPKVAEVLTTGTLIMTSLMTAFTSNPPDIDLAVDTLNINGWKLVKLFVPEEQQDQETMRNAKNAWSEVFLNANELIEDALDASKGGNSREVIKVILRIIETGLNAVAEGVPEQKLLLGAVVDAMNRFADTIMDFAVTMGYIS
jgi:hypothetical protein